MGRRGPGAKPVRVGANAPQATFTPEYLGATRAERMINWIEGLKITSGAHAGKPFLLRDWQRTIIEDIYRTDDTGRRVVRQALITMGRKNGKTALAAALALAHLCGPEAEQRGQVFSAAADRGQAALIFAEMRAFILADPALSARIVIREFKKELEDEITGSIYLPLSSDARKAHGLSSSFYVCDELAQWPSRVLLDNLRTGTGARAEPLGIVVSTMSADPFHVMTELANYAQQVRDGLVEDATFAGHVFTSPQTDDPWDEATWAKANPALGDFRSLEEMRSEASVAQRIPAREAVFRNLYLNQPVEADERLIHARDWDPLGEPFDVAALRGQRCIAGLDLGSASDLTGLALYFPDSGHVLAWGFLPAEQLDQKERADRAPYRLWRDQGCIISTPGRAINKAFVAAKLRELAADYDLQSVAFDRWMFKDLEVICDSEGIWLPFEPHGQGFKDMGPSVEQFERLVLEGKLQHGGNPLLTWCLSNITVNTDPAGARKPAKDRSRGRIDPLVALIMACGQSARMPAEPSYEFTGVLID
ncbi:terminase large subunit [Roseomonas sp. WA12]